MDLRATGARRAILGMIGIAVATAASGCGSSHNSYPAPTVTFDAGRPDTTSSVPDAGTVAPPVVGPGSQRLLLGAALLVGTGPDSCTNQDPSTGDRWCAFALPSTFLGGTDLWVMNVSKAIGSDKPIQCDASDLNCLLLTSTLNDGDLTVHRFFGDTLIYYADTGANGGPVYGWRPGMTAGRRMTDAATGLQCVGHPSTDAVFCYQNLDTTTVAGQATADVLAGKLSVGAPAALPKVVTLFVGLDSETNVGQKYQVGLSPAGDWIAWSTRTDAAGVEILSAQKLNDDASRVVVAEDVARWIISRDSAKWYWLKSYNYDPANPLGTLQMANFPTDTGGVSPVATTLRNNVASAGSVSDKGLVYFGPFLNNVTDLGLIADRDQPTAAKTIDTRVVRLQSVSHDGRTVVYSKTGTSDGLVDLYAGGLDIATPCTLSAPIAVPPPFAALSDPASTVFWSYFNSSTNELVGQYTTLATCQTNKFSSDLWFWTPVKDQGVVFADTVVFTSMTDLSVTLRYAQFTGTTLPAAGTVVQERANQTFAVMLPALSAVVYTINAGGNTDGLYVKSGLPFPQAP
jgi:hypothetical protein